MVYPVSFDIDFKRNSYGGWYIALEGVDGSGKTRMVEELLAYFRKIGKEVVVTREPRKEGSVIGDLIGKVLLGEVKMSGTAFQFLASADRVLNQEEVVIPALKAGKVVLSDRSFWSVVPYAILDMGRSFRTDDSQIVLVAQGLLSMYHQFVIPEVTFFLDVSVEVACERIEKKVSEIEIYEKKEKLGKVIKGYHWLVKEFAEEFCVVDANREIAQVRESMVEKIVDRL